ncbi:UROD/MetE-like protein [Sistotremastrum niveocremeum HHB9708]|uniref:UROD/MetE-like protein n=1 Tax=Sistotremastrum niveocremeum HHB9708 TaxID=1314777 RepID=A0A164XHG0_9AGAM|nr:UROD/MetE-like protein [Sistotremastrum niveocremeum HHB9708]
MSSQSLHLFPPFRAEHIGSLKRPKILLDQRVAFDKKECTPQELRAVEDQSIQKIVDVQRQAGIKTLTDGEFRRHMFFDGVFDNLEGMTLVPDAPASLFKMYVPDVAGFQVRDFKGADTWICTGKLRRTKPFYVDQFNGLKQFVKPEEVPHIKVTICAPEWFHLRHGEHAYNTEIYKNDAEYFAHIAKAYREEIADLYAAGCRNIQIDDPLLAYFCAESMLKGMKEEGVDSEALLDTYIKAYNDFLPARPKDMTIGLHLCRGNFKDGRHFSEGGYDRIAVKLFNEIDVDCYYLEYDTARAGTFEPLQFLPPHKSAVLGVISSKLSQLEDISSLKKRIDEAAETMTRGQWKRTKEEALNQLSISPQCGFASHSEGNVISDEVMAKKLKLVSETAKQIWTDA